MKLLFDQNLSPRLARSLAGVYPDSAHVMDVGLSDADDRAIWMFDREHGFAIDAKDGDFRQLSFLDGPPPKVVWVRLGNCSTDDIATVLRRRADDLRDFASAPEAAFLFVG